MGQDVEGMGLVERAICFTLFVCLAVAVFTTVSQQSNNLFQNNFVQVGLIYLTSIVYLPVKNELGAGFMTDPVMCTSVQVVSVCN